MKVQLKQTSRTVKGSAKGNNSMAECSDIIKPYQPDKLIKFF